jgi:malate permease and related proteins
MLSQFIFIISHVLLPVLVLVGAGAVLQRYQPLNMQTLSRINIYLLVPAFLFINILQSTLTFTQMGGIAAVVLISMALIAGPVIAFMKKAGSDGPQIATVLMGAIIFNAGNFGIPVAELNFGQKGLEVQAVVVAVANLSIWAIGYIILVAAKGGGVKGAMGYFKLPMFYVMVGALFLRAMDWTHPPVWIEYPAVQLGKAVVPLSLVTLGAQMASRARWPNIKLVAPVAVLKLLVMPVAAGVTAFCLGLWPWPGAQIIIAAAGPTAVNTLLLTIELDGDADTAADLVFWTTVLSGITVTLVITCVRAMDPTLPVPSPP